MPTNPNTAEPRKPRRRWFQFRLRTLLIAVAVLGAACGYVAHEASIVRERKALIAELGRLGGPTIDCFGDDDDSPPWIRRMLGDISQPMLIVPKNTDREVVRRIWSAFPEAEVYEYARNDDGLMDLAPLAETSDRS